MAIPSNAIPARKIHDGLIKFTLLSSKTGDGEEMNITIAPYKTTSLPFRNQGRT
jgi:hypothetical protein